MALLDERRVQREALRERLVRAGDARRAREECEGRARKRALVCERVQQLGDGGARRGARLEDGGLAAREAGGLWGRWRGLGGGEDSRGGAR